MKTITKGLSLAALAITVAGAAHAAQDQMPDRNATVTRADAQAKAEAMFERMDANKDGKLDQADRAARMGEMFDKIDADHNGAISRDEFTAAHQRMGEHGDGMGDHAMGGMKDGQGMRRHHGGMGMMGRMGDPNNDGTLTRSEFVGNALKHFDQGDANHDGKLTPDERKAAFGKMHRGMKGMRGQMDGDMPPPPPPAN